MALTLMAGWDFARINSGAGFQYRLTTPSGTSNSIAITSGTYTHDNWASISPSNSYVTGFGDFPTLLQNSLNATSALTGSAMTFTVTWSPTTCYYTITSSGGNFTLDFSTPATGVYLRLLTGFTGNQSGASTYTSTRVPYYCLPTSIGSKSRVRYDYEPDNVAFHEESEDGTSTYGWAREGAPSYYDFTIDHEEIGHMYDHTATSPVLWSWQLFWRHVRTVYPFGCADDSMGNTVHKLRGEGGSFQPRFVQDDYSATFSMDVKTIVLGRYS